MFERKHFTITDIDNSEIIYKRIIASFNRPSQLYG